MTTAAPTQTFKDIIPAEFHDRGHFKTWLEKPISPENYGEFFKSHDNAQALLGKKKGIPGADAKPEEIDAFLGEMRPAKAEEYDIQVGENPDKELLSTFREAMHAGGLSKVQATRLLGKFMPAIQERQKVALEAQKKADDEFAQLVESTFKGDAAAKLTRAQDAIKEHAPPALAAHIGRLDNNSLVLMAGVIDALLEKFTKEDGTVAPGSASGGAGESDIAKLEGERMKLLGDPRRADFTHPEHETVNKRIEEISHAIVALREAAKAKK